MFSVTQFWCLLLNKAKFYEYIESVKPRIAIVTGFVDRTVYEVARCLIM